MKLARTNAVLEMVDIKKGATVTIAPNTVVMLASGLAVTADSSATKIAWTKGGADSWTTSVQIVADKHTTYKTTGSANYAQTYFTTLYDLWISADATPYVDFSNTGKAVLKPVEWTVWNPLDVEVRIAKHLLRD